MCIRDRVSVERKAYICPKLMGLPDMVRHNCRDIRGIIDPCIDMSSNSWAYILSLIHI